VHLQILPGEQWAGSDKSQTPRIMCFSTFYCLLFFVTAVKSKSFKIIGQF